MVAGITKPWVRKKTWGGSTHLLFPLLLLDAGSLQRIFHLLLPFLGLGELVCGGGGGGNGLLDVCSIDSPAQTAAKTQPILTFVVLVRPGVVVTKSGQLRSGHSGRHTGELEC